MDNEKKNEKGLNNELSKCSENKSWREGIMKGMLNLEGVNLEIAAWCLSEEKVNRPDSYVCKHIFEDVFDHYQKKNPPVGATKELVELKEALECKQPPHSNELYLIGLLCGEKCNAYLRSIGKTYLEQKLRTAYRKYKDYLTVSNGSWE